MVWSTQLCNPIYLSDKLQKLFVFVILLFATENSYKWMAKSQGWRSSTLYLKNQDQMINHLAPHSVWIPPALNTAHPHQNNNDMSSSGRVVMKTEISKKVCLTKIVFGKYCKILLEFCSLLLPPTCLQLAGWLQHYSEPTTLDWSYINHQT